MYEGRVGEWDSLELGIIDLSALGGILPGESGSRHFMVCGSSLPRLETDCLILRVACSRWRRRLLVKK